MTTRKWILVGVNLSIIAAILILWQIFVAPWNALQRESTIDDVSSEQARPTLEEGWAIERQQGVDEILGALDKYQIDHDGKLPVKIPHTFTDICAESETEKCPGSWIDLSFLLKEGYLDMIPRDPDTGIDDIRSGFEVRIPYENEGIGTFEVKSVFTKD
jgi:hypothetical protein